MLGLDLGQNAAMSAAAAYFRDGRLEAQACFPELPSLSERGLSDGVGDLYCRMAERGELFQAGRRVSDVAVLLRECLERWGRPVAIACDRWRLAELKEKLEAVRFPLAELVERGQGFKDGGQDVRDFRKAVLGDHVRPSRSLLLRAAMAEARVTGDPSGNWKLAKHVQGGRRANARDDACTAGGSRCGGVSSRSQARKRQAPAHWETSTLRSRREVCNRSRVSRDAPSPGFPPVAAIRMARRNTSDFDTSQRCANASSTRTDSTSSEYVDLIVVMAISQCMAISTAVSISRAPGRCEGKQPVHGAGHHGP